jgi:hypothetical protein
MICSSASSRSEQRAQLLRDDCRPIAAPEWPCLRACDGAITAHGAVRPGSRCDDEPESLAPIRPARHRFCGATRSCDRICKNFFRRVRTCKNRPATLSRPWCAQSARAKTRQRRPTMMLRNPCAMRLSRTRCDVARPLDCGCDACSAPHTGRGARCQRRLAALRNCPPFVKWSRCFLRCAVVIGVQCSSIRECTVP